MFSIGVEQAMIENYRRVKFFYSLIKNFKSKFPSKNEENFHREMKSQTIWETRGEYDFSNFIARWYNIKK